jgi:hypothetical protein
LAILIEFAKSMRLRISYRTGASEMMGDGRSDRCALWFQALLGCAALCPVTSAAADGAPKPTLTVPVAQHCRGVCDPSLVPLENGNAMMTWESDDFRFWSQAIDVKGARLLGAPVELREIDTLVYGTTRPLTIPLGGGDLALVAALANGRLTLTRGSPNPARRVAPKILGNPSELEVQGFAATASGDGIALLVLRGQHMEDISAPRGPMDVELHWLDARGEALRAPMRWTAVAGSTPRIATCAGRLYLAWFGNPGVTITRISASLERAPEQILGSTRGVPVDLGPLVCTDGGVRLFSSWRNSVMSFELAPTLKTIDIASEPTKGAKPPSWQSLKLSAPPYSRNRYLDVHTREGGVQLVVKSQPAKLVTLASEKNARVTQQLDLPRNPTCLPLSDGTQAICAETESEKAGDPECPQQGTKSIRLSFYGQPALQPAANAKSYDYWSSGPIPDARAPAAWSLEHEKALVRCTAPEFQGLRAALTAWCTTPATKPSESAGYRAFCELEEPQSLLSQAIHCSDLPAKCGPVPLVRVPAVDRAEFERGKRVELNHMNCSVWFARNAKGWSVVDRDCTGE